MRVVLVFILCVAAMVCVARARSDSIADSGLPGPHQLPRHIPQVPGRVVADGDLDEDVWNQALAMTMDYEVQPGENIPPPVKTEVFLAYGESELYVAFKAYDPDPSQIRARLRDRDDLGSDDWVCINLDTFNDARRSFLLACNPYGVQSDWIETTGGKGGEWNTIWDSGGRIHDWGYAVEMVIPFSSLRFQHRDEDQIWGVDAIRSYPRMVRHHIGLYPRDRDNNCYLCQATKVVGFAGADPGNNLEIDPTVSGILAQERAETSDYGPFVDSEKKMDAGVTARWGVTPNLTLASTVNPDFSQVEADVFHLDVNTRFALYYNERRPFFLEGGELFNSNERLVYTRTVADPFWGAKLTGKEGSNGIGVFVAQDEYTSLLFPSNEGSKSESLDRNSTVGVFRYRRDLGASSNIGATVTERDAVDYGNHAGSVDANLDLSKNDRLCVQETGTWTEYPRNVVRSCGQKEKLRGESTYLQFNHSVREWDAWGYAVRRHPDFRADAGFISMSDVSNYGGGYERNLYNEAADGWWSSFYVGINHDADLTYDFDRNLDHETNVWANYNGPLQSWLSLALETRREWYQRVRYNQDNLELSGGFFPDPGVHLELGMNWSHETDYENARPGVSLSFEPKVELLLGRHLQMSLNETWGYLDVADGRLVTVNVSRLRTVYQFNRRIFVRAIVQDVYYDYNPALYDDPSSVDDLYHRIATQLLFSYTVNPQTVVHAGYSDNVTGYNQLPLAQTGRVFFFKLGYALVL